jgi:hypothetical protein
LNLKLNLKLKRKGGKKTFVLLSLNSPSVISGENKMALAIDQQIINGEFDKQLCNLELAIKERRNAQREKLSCDEHEFYYDIDHNNDRDSEEEYPKIISQYCDLCEYHKNLYIGDDEFEKIWKVLSK